MSGDFTSYPITGVVTPSDPDRRGRDGYPPRRHRQPHPPHPHPRPQPAESHDPLADEPMAPPHIGTRINVRV